MQPPAYRPVLRMQPPAYRLVLHINLGVGVGEDICLIPSRWFRFSLTYPMMGGFQGTLGVVQYTGRDVVHWEGCCTSGVVWYTGSGVVQWEWCGTPIHTCCSPDEVLAIRVHKELRTKQKRCLHFPTQFHLCTHQVQKCS